MNFLFWRKRKTKEKIKKRKRRLQQATVRQHIASDSQHENNMSADIYKQLNELTLLLSKHDLFLREDHHRRGLVPLTRFLSENFYKLSASQQARIKQNIEFIETDKNILAILANSRRLRVVQILTALKGKDIKNRQYVSERVNRLVEAGILERRRVGKNVYYSKLDREPMKTDTSGDT